MRRSSTAFATLMGTLLLLTPLFFPKPTLAVSSVSPPTFDVAGMNTSMKNVYNWAVVRTLPNGTATLNGMPNNLLSTSLVGRVLTYTQLEIGNTTSFALIQKMINAEHILLQNPRYISFGIWPVQDRSPQLFIHRDVQKFLLRAYGLTLNQTARSDLVKVTQDIYLNMPGNFEYYDTLAWGFANSVWFAFYNGSPLPPSSDFTSAVQDLQLHYNLTAAKADSANSFVDFSRLLHYITAPEFTDSYFRLEGNSLDQTYHNLEAQLADQLVTRQLPDGNISTLKSYKPYLVEDYAKDLDSAYYLNNKQIYASSAFKAESFLTSLYLQPNGNMSLPKRNEGLTPFVAIHLISIANDIKPSSTSDWYSALSQASKILNYTMSIQNPDGTFNFFTNSTNPGFAYTTISSVSSIVDSYVVLRNSNVLVTSSSQSTSSVSVTSSGSSGSSIGSSSSSFSSSSSSSNQSASSGSVSSASGTVSVSSTTTSRSAEPASSSTTVSANGQASKSTLPVIETSRIPSWAYFIVPIILVIALAIAYETRHRNRYRGLVDK